MLQTFVRVCSFMAQCAVEILICQLTGTQTSFCVVLSLNSFKLSVYAVTNEQNSWLSSAW